MVDTGRFSDPRGLDERMRTLSAVIIGCEDAAHELEAASGQVTNRELGRLLSLYAAQHRASAHYLQGFAAAEGGDPPTHPSMLARLLGLWIRVRGRLPQADRAVIATCEPQQTALARACRQALRQPLSRSIRRFLRRQKRLAERTLDLVRVTARSG